MQLLIALPGVVTSCLLVWVLFRLLDKQNAQHEAHRTEVAHAARALLEQSQLHREDIRAITTAHAEQINVLLTAHRREVATLCQRLQAPQVAVAEHLGYVSHDPSQPDLDDDMALLAQREKDLEQMARELEMRAEDLAAA